MADTKEKPIPFSAEMVRAILDGRKTQTRRIDKCMAKFPPISTPDISMISASKGGEKRLCATWHADNGKFTANWCPYGQPGDRLWVRETFSRTNPGGNDGVYFYKADGKFPDSVGGKDYTNVVWKPSIHMPRAASRILLEITDVRVERLQDISEEDALAEGIDETEAYYMAEHFLSGGSSVQGGTAAVFAYIDLWEKLHGPGSWEANPWVWVIGFKVVEVKG